MSRLPIRARLTLAFTVVMAVVLAATGVYVRQQQASDLSSSIDGELRARAQELAAVAAAAGGDLEPARLRLQRRAGAVGQVVDDRGRLVPLSPSLGRVPLLGAAELAAARRGPLLTTRAHVAGLAGRVRVHAVPEAVEEHRLVIVVASSLHQRDASLHALTRTLLLGGGAALLLAALAGFGVATAALGPVEAMRARAASISGRRRGERLPRARAQDELGRLGDTLNGMLARLEEARARERAFVADASHELRTPLAVLRAEVELALSRPRGAGELEAALRSAAEEIERLAGLAADLLLLARADDGDPVARPQRVDVAGLLDEVRRRALAGGARADEVIVAVDGEPAVTGDADALARALLNLVDNGLRHGAGPVLVAARAERGAVVLEVTDHGPGFDQRFLPVAFERFARAPAARATDGTGLGLAIVRATAARHGGTAGVENAADGGARAWMGLPAATLAGARTDVDRPGPSASVPTASATGGIAFDDVPDGRSSTCA